MVLIALLPLSEVLLPLPVVLSPLPVVLPPLPVVLLTQSAVSEGCADMSVPVTVGVVATLSFVVDGYRAIQEQSTFWPSGDLLKFVMLSCPE